MKVWVEGNTDGRFIVKHKRIFGFTKTHLQDGLEWSSTDHFVAVKKARQLAETFDATYLEQI